jgi:hypothetical protein
MTKNKNEFILPLLKEPLEHSPREKSSHVVVQQISSLENKEHVLLGGDTTSSKDFSDEGQGKIIPNDCDILGGRGAGVNAHPGNVFYRSLVKIYRPLYLKIKLTSHKRSIIKEINGRVLSTRARFLKLNDQDDWVCISTAEAEKKTGQALREKFNTNSKAETDEIVGDERRVSRKREMEDTLNRECRPTISRQKRLKTLSATDEAVSNERHVLSNADDRLRTAGDHFHVAINDGNVHNITRQINQTRRIMNELKSKHDRLEKEHSMLINNLFFEINQHTL